ncbi:DUF1841 family protein [candidate division KSB1 bacterium]|nr:DUF1841 family protein [candidate division KSB1 bacterium]RQW01448.1 MAG: DUF1841 family protein [candidate division KSB1 bacterium]
MQFPEQLDNRSFRLLVERTVQRQKDKKPLSKMEQELADLIRQFPELNFHSTDKININVQFADSETNPFLILSAIWEMTKQIQHDAPKGIKKIITDYFHTTNLRSEDLYQIAEIYLYLNADCQKNDRQLTDKEYLWEVYYALYNTDENVAGGDYKKEDKNTTDDVALQPNMINQAFIAIARELHDQSSFIKLSPNASSLDIYSELPLEWIYAMSNYWQRPEQKLKRDHINEILNYFSAPEFIDDLPNQLSREEKECLLFVLNNDNCVPYAKASKEYGPEHNDGYWWTQDIPKSTLGNLRMKGLLIVGEVTMGDETKRVVMIPHDLRETIRKAL